MWNKAYALDANFEDLIPVAKSRHSRVRALGVELKKRGWTISGKPLRGHGKTVALDKHWSEVRFFAVKAMRDAVWQQLAARRPGAFGGLTTLETKMHTRMLACLPPYHASILTRIWAGCAMTRAHKFNMSMEETSECECCAPVQDLPHLLYRCPLAPEPTFTVQAWSRLPPFASTSLLFPPTMNKKLFGVWKEVCMRAVSVLDRRIATPPSPSFPLKGHQLAMAPCSDFVYCMLCHVTRCSRDAKWICTRQCEGEAPLLIGEYRVFRMHVLRLHMRTWKRHSKRPKVCCVSCGQEAWATALQGMGECRAALP